MNEEKKESPIGVLWGWGKPYHGKFIGSIIHFRVMGDIEHLQLNRLIHISRF